MAERDDTFGEDSFDALEAWFRTARVAPEPSDALMARILADADAVQQAARVSARPSGLSAAQPSACDGFWRSLGLALGGAGGMAGLATATLAGVWMGFAQPAALSGLEARIAGDATMLDQVDLLPGLDSYLTMGE